ncbi:MAG: hypothetical protein EXX96DRAFT_542624 [Benjaminiella poitrasii]|nr:MAG: hypothetical protein EXX96DRAFT_542624 [Benjaminiella poitrasii]
MHLTNLWWFSPFLYPSNASFNQTPCNERSHLLQAKFLLHSLSSPNFYLMYRFLQVDHNVDAYVGGLGWLPNGYSTYCPTRSPQRLTPTICSHMPPNAPSVADA